LVGAIWAALRNSGSMVGADTVLTSDGLATTPLRTHRRFAICEAQIMKPQGI
jgi:hypothetical protein